MSTINDLSVVTSVDTDDKFPLWKNADGVTRAAAIGALDARYFLKSDLSNLAISSATETFTAVASNPTDTQFVPGYTVALTVQGAYGSAQNLDIFFDGVYQSKSTYSLINQQITFTSPIPVGVSQVDVNGGDVRQIGVPSDGTVTDAKIASGTALANRLDMVNVLDYGADRTGATDSTNAFLTAVAKARKVYVPSGLYKTAAIVIPAGTTIVGEGAATVIQPIDTFTAQKFWSTSGANNVRLANFFIGVSKTQFPSTIPFYFDTGDNILIEDVRITEGGYLGCYANNLTNSTADRVRVDTALAVGMQWSGGSRNTFRACAVMGTDQSHGLEMQGGDQHLIDSCVSINASGFGITSQGTTNSTIKFCRIHNSKVESVTIGGDGGDGNTAEYNVATWDAGVSQDFGMSCGANGAVGTQRNRFIGNLVRGCGKSGIALAGDSTAGWAVLGCEVSNNIIIDSNQLGLGPVNGGGAGVILYGAYCTGNTVQNNTIIDTGGGKLNYGIFETQIGAGGYPSQNKFFGGNVSGQSGVRVNKRQQSSESHCQSAQQPYQSWTPVLGASSGTLTSASTVAAYYIEDYAQVEFYAQFQITTNGTAAQAFTFTLPFAVAYGMGSGREDVLTGSGLTVTMAGSLATVRTVTNSYPGGNGAIIEVSGKFVRTF